MCCDVPIFCYTLQPPHLGKITYTYVAAMGPPCGAKERSLCVLGQILQNLDGGFLKKSHVPHFKIYYVVCSMFLAMIFSVTSAKVHASCVSVLAYPSLCPLCHHISSPPARAPAHTLYPTPTPRLLPPSRLGVKHISGRVGASPTPKKTIAYTKTQSWPYHPHPISDAIPCGVPSYVSLCSLARRSALQNPPPAVAQSTALLQGHHYRSSSSSVIYERRPHQRVSTTGPCKSQID